jgi:hypothetical protein
MAMGVRAHTHTERPMAYQCRNAKVEEAAATRGAGQEASECVPAQADGLLVMLGAFSHVHTKRRSLVHLREDTASGKERKFA